MKVAKLPKDELKRLEALKFYKILDTLPEKSFDDLTFLASEICGTPVALVSLVDESRQWFKSAQGIDATETPRDVAFCAHAILKDEIFEVPDSHKDERFADNPLATGDTNVRFYAGAPLKTPSGHNIGTLCVIDNKPRELSESQRQSLAALSRQVVSLLELRSNQEKAMQASQAKTNFLANMSHEIRTPLGGVLSFTELLLEMDLPEDALEQIGYIKDSSENLLEIVNDILDISKIEAQKLKLNITENSPSKILLESSSVFKAITKKKGIAFDITIGENIPEIIRCDGVRLRQIFLNLMGNAIKFTSVGSVNAFLFLKNSQLYFEVKDTGIGVSEEDQKRIFKSFEQESTSSTKQYGGTGLGLPICVKLASLMGAQIEMESEKGSGSLFRLILPLAGLCVERSSVQIRESEVDVGPRELAILAAEDSEINQNRVCCHFPALHQIFNQT